MLHGLLILACLCGALSANINGAYQIANPPPGAAPNLTLGRSGGRYFDVYSPVILSLYSQVSSAFPLLPLYLLQTVTCLCNTVAPLSHTLSTGSAPLHILPMRHR